MIPKKLLLENKFDKKYSPAYYEDVDLAHKLKSKGFKIFYQPSSVIYHEEGSSSKNKINSAKRFQEINRKKFYKKWKDIIKNDPKQHPFLASISKDSRLN